MTWSQRISVGVVLFACSCRPSGHPEDATIPAAAMVRSENTIRFDPASPQLERIRVAQATAAMLPVEEFDAPGKVEPLPTRLAKVALPLSGRVRQVLATLGDHVRRGQTLMTVETPESSTLQSSLRQAQADVRYRQAAVAKTDADVSRVRDLLANRAIAQKEIITTEAAQAEATAALEQARATEDDVTRRLRLLGVDVETPGGLVTVRAPMDGEVVEITVAPGEYRSDTAAPIMTIADLSRVWVMASVPESALATVQTNQPVTIGLTAYPGQSFDGRVARIAGALDPDTRTAKVIVELNNARRLLKPEMFARVHYTGPAHSVLTVPIGAIAVNRGELARYGLNISDVQDVIELAIGGRAVGAVFEGERRFDVTVRYVPDARTDASAIAQILVATPAGGRVPLGQLARIETVRGPSIIARRENERQMTVRTNIRGRDQGSFVAEAQARVAASVQLPFGYRVTWGGQFENLARARARLSIILPITVLIVFALLFVAFASVRDAALVLVNVPFSLVGGILALYLRGIHLSVSAAVGFITLFGVAVMGGLLYVAEINRRLSEPATSLEDAVVSGAKSQIRPMFMLILVAMLGMMPAALATGIGSDIQRPLATVIVGGLVSTLLLTLLVLPSLYYVVGGSGVSSHPAVTSEELHS